MSRFLNDKRVIDLGGSSNQRLSTQQALARARAQRRARQEATAQEHLVVCLGRARSWQQTMQFINYVTAWQIQNRAHLGIDLRYLVRLVIGLSKCRIEYLQRFPSCRQLLHDPVYKTISDGSALIVDELRAHQVKYKSADAHLLHELSLDLIRLTVMRTWHVEDIALCKSPFDLIRDVLLNSADSSGFLRSVPIVEASSLRDVTLEILSIISSATSQDASEDEQLSVLLDIEGAYLTSRTLQSLASAQHILAIPSLPRVVERHPDFLSILLREFPFLVDNANTIPIESSRTKAIAVVANAAFLVCQTSNSDLARLSNYLSLLHRCFLTFSRLGPAPDTHSSAGNLPPKPLQSITCPSHISIILLIGQRLRPLMSSVLIDISHWTPASQQIELFRTLIYSSVAQAPLNPSIRSKNAGALIREIWRTCVRSGQVAKALSHFDQSHGPFSNLTAPLAASDDVGHEWTPLMLVCHMYSVMLKTMGDDEFFSATQQPLSLDDVIEFSSVLRDLAFSLLWLGSQLDQKDVPQTGVPFWDFFRLVRTLIVQLSDRDDRRPFAPVDHWLKAENMDQESLIDAASKDDHLNKTLDFENTSAQQIGPDMPSALQRNQNLVMRMRLLRHLPLMIPFETRVQILDKFMIDDRDSYNYMDRVNVNIRRNHLAADGFAHLAKAHSLKGNRIQITFIDQFGEPEMGIDGGGLFKEFITCLTKEVFNPDAGLWAQNDDGQLYPATSSYTKEERSLEWYQFMGRIVGLAIYRGILLDAHFASFFLAKLTKRSGYLDDLASLDASLYKGLLYLKHCDEPEALSLYFAVASEEFGQIVTEDLVENGSNVPVTKANRLQYITLLCNYRLNKQSELQSKAFISGLQNILQPSWLRMFSHREISILLGGTDEAIDLEDLRANTVYAGYDEHDASVQLFWEVVEEFNSDQKSHLIKFATSASRAPLLGFKQLNPRFAIQKAGGDLSRLPTSSTCMNLLKLPPYLSKSLMREKLLQSIYSEAGFDLS